MDESVLAPEALGFLKEFAATLLGRRFYLGGGSALALQISHRLSDDLDFFTIEAPSDINATIDTPLQRFQGRITLREKGQVDAVVRGTKVSFISYPFPPIHPLVVDEAVQLAAPDEIALMKAYSLGRRIAARDYVDLYYLLHDGATSLGRLREEADRKFVLDGERLFDYAAFLRQLVDTTDVPDWDETLSLVRDKSLKPHTIDDFFARLIQEVNGVE